MVAAALSAPAATAQAVDSIYERLEQSVWTVGVVDRNGQNAAISSAVVVGPGRLVTTCGALRQAAHVRVMRANVSYGATLEYPDAERNLCQLKVANFRAPAVVVAEISSLRVGMRVYAIGSPKGMESTLSDGLLSGLRRDETNQVRMLQTSAPVSPGSGGGGLFDAQGRLIGIMAGSERDGQNLNFAIPAALIAELPARGRRALEEWMGIHPAAAQVGLAASAPLPGPMPEAPMGRRPGDWFQYAIVDRSTGTRRLVALEVDRTEGDGVLFNGGRRREDGTGMQVAPQSAALGELDLLTPPGGWPALQQQAQELRFENQVLGRLARFELRATPAAPALLHVAAGEFETVRIELTGWHTRAGLPSGEGRAPYSATVWWSPQLRRVVRFSVDSKTSVGMGSPGSFMAWESLELVRLDRR
ncbi:MAG: serine protease [Burkholderiales bacterium]|nr:serine protease [Burkholderiales bacterium]